MEEEDLKKIYKTINAKVDKKYYKLNIRKKLPNIILPANKMQMFIDWWNKDLKYQNTIPIAFNEGYFSMENTLVPELDFNNQEVKNTIKEIAKKRRTTYRKIENEIKEGDEIQKKITVYFQFKDNSILEIYTYFSNAIANYGKIDLKSIDINKPNLEIKEIQFGSKNATETLFIYIFYLFAASMWYISTTTKQTKYIYNKKDLSTLKTKEKNKNIVNVKEKRIVETPFYDFSKIRYVEVDKLVQRRKGWTYSHAFTVCGHYRHYKNGKTIFVKSFIKGKNKPLKAQEIIISPKE